MHMHMTMSRMHMHRYAAYYRGRTAEDIDRGLATPAEVYQAALAMRMRAAEPVEVAMGRAGGVGALLTPAATSVAPAGLVWTGDAGMQQIWSFLGWPVLGMPRCALV